MFASNFFALTGDINLEFSLLPMHSLCQRKFLGKFSRTQRISLSSKFSSLTCEGELVDEEEKKKTQKEKHKFISAYFSDYFSAFIISQADTTACRKISD